MPDTEAGIAAAAAALRADEIVAYPTETVYGLAANPLSERALDRLFTAKGREERTPVLLIVFDTLQLVPVVGEITERAALFMHEFWPGPLTLLFPAAADLPGRLTGDGGKIAVRCPGCKTARALCAAFGGPLTSTSANVSGRPSARSVPAIEVPDVAIAIDGGELPESAPSTLFDPDAGRVLREGVIPAEQLLRLL